jgi:hypothetical protein
MPQFDLFIWVSLSFWTIFFFQVIYYILLYFIIFPFSNLQKTLIKLYLFFNNSKAVKLKNSLNFLEYYNNYKTFYSIK